MSGIEARFKGQFGRFALDAGFTCPDKGVTGLFGPSGCGKTSILRCVAGLNRVGEGYLRIGEDVWQDRETFCVPHKRSVGYVFQEARLFPHLSVRGNLEYGLQRSRETSPRITVDTTIGLLGLEPLLTRSTAALSGGERQRVAIGRALLSQPRILLMDEPLSALDRDSKQEILPYLQGLSGRLSIPVLYVSHDMSEIEHLADHLVLVGKGGTVQASGKLDALLTDFTLPLARSPDSAAMLTVTVKSYDAHYDITQCQIDGGPFFVPGHLGAPGARRRIRVRASDVSLIKSEPQGTSVLNVMHGRILSAQMVSAHRTLVLLAIAGQTGEVKLLSNVTRKSWDGLGLSAGDPVYAQIKGMALADDGARDLQ